MKLKLAVGDGTASAQRHERALRKCLHLLFSLGDTWPMDRDLGMLQQAADLLSADLRRVLGGGWDVRVEEGLIMVVSDGERTERVLVDDAVNLEAWPDDAWSDTYRDSTLQDDASEAVSGELFEVLRLWGVDFSPCPEHESSLVDVCSMTWVCPGPPSHDLAALGSLTV